MTLLTVGFAWTIDQAVRRHATDALVDAGISGVSVDNSYRDVTLTGPAVLETAAVSTVADAQLVQDVVYVAVGSSGPEPSPTPTVEPLPSLEPSPEPTDTCTAISPECLGGVGYLTHMLDSSDKPTFAFDSASLTASDREILDGVALAIVESLSYDPEIRVTVAGHSDSSGPLDYNQKLSVLRAQVVRDYLIRQGVPADALSIIGYGETKPIDSNDTETGRASNRRVELTIAKD